jgi:hypothetical protein
MGDIKNQIYKEALSASALKKLLLSSSDDVGKFFSKIFKKSPKQLERIKNVNKAVKGSGWSPINESVKSVDDVIEAVARKTNSSWDEAKKLVEQNIHTSGSGSIFADIAAGGAKKIKPLKKPIEKFQKGSLNKLTDLDMKAGEKLRKKFPKKLGKMFENEVKVRSGDVTHHFKTNQLTAPYIKTKDKVLPLVGGMTIANKLYPNEENKRDANGPPKGR